MKRFIFLSLIMYQPLLGTLHENDSNKSYFALLKLFLVSEEVRAVCGWVQSLASIYNSTVTLMTFFIPPAENIPSASEIEASCRLAKAMQAENNLNDCIHKHIFGALAQLKGEPLEENTLPEPCNSDGLHYALFYGEEALERKKAIYTKTFNEQLKKSSPFR